VALIVGYIFVLTPGDPLDHLRWPEDSLERLAGRDMEVRAAVARAAPWERRLYAILSGGEESVDDWVRWHEELAQVSSSPDVDLDRLILLGEVGRTAAVREGVEEWETHDEAAAQRKAWITAAYLAPSLPRSAGRGLITEVRDELPWRASPSAQAMPSPASRRKPPSPRAAPRCSIAGARSRRRGCCWPWRGWQAWA
jgi:hypothetical protein